MELIDVVMKLNGPVEPVGETYADGARLANLRALCHLTGELLDQIASVASLSHVHMASVKAARDVAATFMADVADDHFATPRWRAAAR